MKRRQFLKRTGLMLGSVWTSHSASFPGSLLARTQSGGDDHGYGPLIDDPDKVMDLPEGFRYKIVGRSGERMSDGFYLPGLPDGMGTFEGPDGTTIVLRNHEVFPEYHPENGPFGPKNELLGRISRRSIYDPGRDGSPALGAVTSIVYDTRLQEVKSQFLSLAGTLTNCSGGVTPWNSWISCEEIFLNPSFKWAKKHGYVFEVPASADPRIVKPVPLKAMGRFVHESVAVDPRTSILYQTEDQLDGLIYRFLPARTGRLEEGGRLQCLGIDFQPKMDTRNWGGQKVKTAGILPVKWIDLDKVDPKKDNLRIQGFAKGGAFFASGEGMTFFGDAVYFDCTNGGPIKAGQVWRYVPSPFEGTEKEKESPGKLELLVEVLDRNVCQNPDQMTGTPWGDIFVCEDGFGVQHLFGVTRQGDIYRFARNVLDESEFAGICFSPDGSTAFVNYLRAGLTFAITGPWKSSTKR